MGEDTRFRFAGGSRNSGICSNSGEAVPCSSIATVATELERDGILQKRDTDEVANRVDINEPRHQSQRDEV